MSRWALLLGIVAAGLLVFGYWGVYTPAGRKRYDEMAGIIPMACWGAGWLLGIVSLIWLAISAASQDGPR